MMALRMCLFTSLHCSVLASISWSTIKSLTSRSLKSVASRQRLTCRWHKPPLFSVRAVLNEHGFFVCRLWLVIFLSWLLKSDNEITDHNAVCAFVGKLQHDTAIESRKCLPHF